MRRIVPVILAVLFAIGAPHAQTPAPQDARVTSAITLAVDARETPRRLLHARESMSVTPGTLTLVYPKWLPGEHAPDGPVTDLVGLSFSIGGRRLAWRRDPVDLYAFHVEIPPGASTLDIAFDFLPAIGGGGFSSASSDTAHLGIYSWNQVVLYPAGARSDDVNVRASLQLPEGWKFGTSLRVSGQNGATTSFGQVSLTTLVDSPVIAGEHFRAVPIDTSSRPIEVDLVADGAGSLEASTELTQKWQRLAREADEMFGARHFDRYHFLLTLSDRVQHFGLEHHQSNDSRVAENAVVTQSPALGVMAHEFVHSWNGKYRRPAGLATPDFQQPMVGDLLWVYEGLTQYLGNVLAVRSGLWTESYYRDRLAQVAAYLDSQPGRQWRPLVDTTVSAQLLYFAPGQWASYRRSTDFYDEGWLIWLDVDTEIRQLTNGRKSIEDFCHLFHGGESGTPSVKPYTFDEVAAALNQVVAHDWKGFLSARVFETSEHAPLGGILKSGWRFTYSEGRNEYTRSTDGDLRRTDAAYTLGLRVRTNDAVVTDVFVGSPADKAGLAPGMQLLAVNGMRFSADALRNAIVASKSATGAFTLEVQNDDVVKTVMLDYRGGAREPHLERDMSKPDVLAQILTARSR